MGRRPAAIALIALGALLTLVVTYGAYLGFLVVQAWGGSPAEVIGVLAVPVIAALAVSIACIVAGTRLAKLPSTEAPENP